MAALMSLNSPASEVNTTIKTANAIAVTLRPRRDSHTVPSKIYEAMASGRPVLLSADGNKDLFLAHVSKRPVETIVPKPRIAPRASIGTQTTDDLLVTPDMIARASAAIVAAAIGAVAAAAGPRAMVPG